MTNKLIYNIFLCSWVMQGTTHAQVREYYHRDPQGLLEDQSAIILGQAYKSVTVPYVVMAWGEYYHYK